MPKVIGLTGGIASGKSTVSELLSVFGFKVVDADKAAREAVKKGSKGLAQVREVFGDEAIDENGEMNRRYMGDLVFNHPEKTLRIKCYHTSYRARYYGRRKARIFKTRI